MSDRLDLEIQRVRESLQRASDEAEEAIRKRDLLGERLDALVLAASLRPAVVANGAMRPIGVPGKGRQPGAISKTWRSILVATSQSHPFGANEDEIADIAKSAGLENVRPKDVRDRMTDYEGHGYVRPTETGGWLVTNIAIARFISAGSRPIDADIAENTADPSLEPAAQSFERLARPTLRK